MSSRFPRQIRLVSKADFSNVFAQPEKLSGRYFTVLVRVKPTQTQARLGLAVAKKTAKLAVQRNRLKRLIRESFRHQRLCKVDVVVIARPPAAEQENAVLTASLERQWAELRRRCVPSS